MMERVSENIIHPSARAYAVLSAREQYFMAYDLRFPSNNKTRADSEQINGKVIA